jgi:hypothetical protein
MKKWRGNDVEEERGTKVGNISSGGGRRRIRKVMCHCRVWIDSGVPARLAAISGFRGSVLAFARTLGLWVGHGKTLIDAENGDQERYVRIRSKHTVTSALRHDEQKDWE